MNKQKIKDLIMDHLSTIIISGVAIVLMGIFVIQNMVWSSKYNKAIENAKSDAEANRIAVKGMSEVLGSTLEKYSHLELQEKYKKDLEILENTCISEQDRIETELLKIDMKIRRDLWLDEDSYQLRIDEINAFSGYDQVETGEILSENE